MKGFCEKRIESVQGQLDGTIPSTDAGQQEDSSSLIDASDLTLSDMGSMGQGGNSMPGSFGPGESSGFSGFDPGSMGENGFPGFDPDSESGFPGFGGGEGGSGQFPGGDFQPPDMGDGPPDFSQGMP
ncbi:MAG: hypothetical protein IJI78_08710 [Oscillospiraceae bacterium]|nr:hypothetical protein [Oscillospiraceae bacterium]